MSRDFASGEPFVVALGDTIIRSGNFAGLVRRMIKSHEAHKAAATIAVVEVEADEVSHYGIVRPKGRGQNDFEISDIVEKPAADQAPSRLAVAARYVFGPAIFEALDRTTPGLKGELELTDAFRTLIRMGKPVRCVRLKPDETRYDIGSPVSYFRAFIDFAISDQQYGYRIRQYVQKRLREF
jgi:UTP--glucose-1-phosphate uridylyltransferase